MTCSLASTVLAVRTPVHRRCCGAPPDRAPRTSGRSTGPSGSTPGRTPPRCGPSRRKSPCARSWLLLGLDVLVGPRSAGWLWCLMAAFSAGRPKASQPMGCSTSKPAHLGVAGHHVADRCSCARAPCACRPRDTGTSPGHTSWAHRNSPAPCTARPLPRPTANGARSHGGCRLSWHSLENVAFDRAHSPRPRVDFPIIAMMRSWKRGASARPRPSRDRRTSRKTYHPISGVFFRLVRHARCALRSFRRRPLTNRDNLRRKHAGALADYCSGHLTSRKIRPTATCRSSGTTPLCQKLAHTAQGGAQFQQVSREPSLSAAHTAQVRRPSGTSSVTAPGSGTSASSSAKRAMAARMPCTPVMCATSSASFL